MRASRLFALPFLAATCAAAAPVDFNRDIRPIISEKCFHCHGPDEESREAKLRLDLRESAIAERDGFRAIVPGRPDDSELIIRIESKDADEVMPPPKEHHEMTAKEIKTLRQWITEGAAYAKHWAFEKPSRPAVPNQGNATGAIDAFISSELQKHDLQLSEPADRYTLLRRLTLDLVGLPPSPTETTAFISDQEPGAYERAVDRLLASPDFGERWARMWLDCGRYADSTGYGSDKLRPFMWPWRNWVIEAFNRNLPYDQFTIEQLAGDLLPNATKDQVLATTFHRNTMTNVEGGTIDEEYRVAAVKDRVATTMQVWMGLTAGCAQCHTHKFDPISHRDYYQLFAVFNQTEDSDREDEEPRLQVPSADEEKEMARLTAKVADLESRTKLVTPELEEELHAWEAAMHRPVTWTTLPPTSVKASSGQKLSVEPDGTTLAIAASPDTDTYEITTMGPSMPAITAIRVEALPDDRFPHRGPGKAENGNAVLSEIVAATVAPASEKRRGRFVRIEVPGKGKILSLAEVEVFSGTTNLAPQGKATQSSTDFEGSAQLAIDGKTDGHFHDGKSVTHTETTNDPWWELDLGSERELDHVVVWNRTDSSPERLKGARVILLDDLRKEVARDTVARTPSPQTPPLLNGTTAFALTNASSDFAQPDFDAAKAIDRSEKTGWAFAGATGRPHAIVFECTKPVPTNGGALKLTLAQTHGSQHTFGRLRISVTGAPAPIRELPPAIRETLAIEPSERTSAQRETLLDYFRPLSQSHGKLVAEMAATKAALAKIKPVRVPVLRELSADKHRKTHILSKGNYLLKGEEVTAGLLSEIAPEHHEKVDRLTLAQWIISPENPLTSRVAVNRFWSQIFGSGLVESEEDFGTQGTLPSHPELLDWLAVEFRESGWDVKALLRQIVTSQTYRQTSKATPELLQKDPRCRLLSRYPRRRLGAEEVRDQALLAAGLLSRKMGGPSVYPPQPAGLWNVAFNGGSRNEYQVSTGEDRWRRGLYTIWRRTMPNPTMVTFDAPSREMCTLRRVPTNTPLQAFVTLNDPVFVECAQAFARRILKEGGSDTAARLRFALEVALGRPAGPAQIAPLQELLEDELLNYQQLPDDAKKLATDPLGPLPAETNFAEVAAWTSVANVLLNLDGVLTKN